MSVLSDAISRLCHWIKPDEGTIRCEVLSPTELNSVRQDIELVLDVFHLPDKQDRRLTYSDTDDILLHLVWCMKPDAPQIIAVCSSLEKTDQFRSAATRMGGLFYVETVVMDHGFGQQDIQTIMYREAGRRGRRSARSPSSLTES